MKDTQYDNTDNLYQMILYLLTPPNNYQGGVERGLKPYSQTLLQHADLVELAFKHHLAGMTTTYDAISVEIQSFLSFDSRLAPEMILCVLTTIQKDILREEWYELMPDFLLICHHITLHFGISI